MLSLWRGNIRAKRSSIAPSVFEGVVRRVSAETGVSRDLIMSRGRARPIAHARQRIMYELREIREPDGEPRYSFPAIARALGLMDHTSVIYGIRAHKARLIVREAA